MAHDQSDLRLRRAALGRADPPADTVLGSDRVLRPLAITPSGFCRGTSLPGAGDGSLAIEHDEAEGKTTSAKGSLLGTPMPFVLKR